MGESQGGVSPNEALTFHWLHLSGLMMGHLGGARVAGWLGEGRGDHAPCAIVCLVFYPNLANSGGVPCADLGNSPWGCSYGGSKWGGLKDLCCQLATWVQHIETTSTKNPLLGWGPVHCVGLEVGGWRFGSC